MSILVPVSAPSPSTAASADILFPAGQWSTPHFYDLETGRSAWRPALVVDSDGVPHGVFIDMSSAESTTILWYLTGSDSTWLSGSITGTEEVGSFSIAIDADDDLHMCAAVPGEVRYFVNYETDSSYSVIESVSADSCKVIVDVDGVVHVLYLDAESSLMKNARLIGGEWAIESVEEVTMMDSVTLGSDGTVHGCFYSDESPLVYFTNSSGDWEFETVDSGCDVQWWSPTVAILSDGTPVLSYGDMLNENVKVGHRVGGEWTISVFASDAGYPSMAVDTYDNLVLCYLSQSSVFVMTSDAGGLMWLAVNSFNQIGSPTAVATDADGYVHVLYRYSYTLWNQDSSASIDSDSLVYATNSLDVPRGPSGATLSAEREGLRLSWGADNGDYATGVTGYRIYRGESEGVQSYLGYVDSSELTYLDESAEPGTDYYYRITAFNEAGESLFESAAVVDTVGWTWETGMSSSDYGLIVASAIVVVLVVLLVYQKTRHKPQVRDSPVDDGQRPKGP